MEGQKQKENTNI